MYLDNVRLHLDTQYMYSDVWQGGACYCLLSNSCSVQLGLCAGHLSTSKQTLENVIILENFELGPIEKA